MGELITFDDVFGQPGAVEFLRRLCRADRLPHAMLFDGPVGVGKARCAAALAASFLCLKPRGDLPCGKCESCIVLPSGNHPDYHVIIKELIRYYDKTGKSKATVHSIHSIRAELIEKAAHTSVMGRGKFFVIEQADLMSEDAQNSMLKTLEEPAGRAAIVLLSDAPYLLLPTVLSRCQVVRFALLDAALVARELKQRGIDAATAAEAAELSEGSLGGALSLISDGTLATARQLRERIEELFAGRAAADLSGFLSKSAAEYAQKQLERDPLSSKEAATRAAMSLYLHLAAEQFRRRLHEDGDSGDLERACRAIDATRRCQMYLDANVNAPVALGQLAAAWTEEFASA